MQAEKKSSWLVPFSPLSSVVGMPLTVRLAICFWYLTLCAGWLSSTALTVAALLVSHSTILTRFPVTCDAVITLGLPV